MRTKERRSDFKVDLDATTLPPSQLLLPSLSQQCPLLTRSRRLFTSTTPLPPPLPLPPLRLPPLRALLLLLPISPFLPPQPPTKRPLSTARTLQFSSFSEVLELVSAFFFLKSFKEWKRAVGSVRRAIRRANGRREMRASFHRLEATNEADPSRSFLSIRKGNSMRQPRQRLPLRSSLR